MHNVPTLCNFQPNVTLEALLLILLSGLHAIELSNNPWACDCRLRPLKHWLLSNNVPHSKDLTCDSPQRLAGLKFANLQVDEFACPPELLSAPRYVEANVGEFTFYLTNIFSKKSSKFFF